MNRRLDRIMAKWPYRALTIALCALLISLIAVTRSLMVDYNTRIAPIATSGAAPGPVDADQFTIEIEDVEVARAFAGTDEVVWESDDDSVWLVVHVAITSTDRDLIVGEPAWLEVGRYTHTSESPLNSTEALEGQELSAGIPVSGSFVFELPEDRLTSPTLRVGASASRFEDRLSAEAVVDLGLPADPSEFEITDLVTVLPPEIGSPA